MMYYIGSEVELEYFKWKDEFDEMDEIPAENKEMLYMNVNENGTLKEDYKIW